MNVKFVFGIISVLIIGLLCIGSVSAAENYNMWKGDVARSGYTEETGPLSNSTLWEMNYLKSNYSGMYPAVDASPVAADGYVYYSVYGDSKNLVNGIYCADAYTGEQKWCYPSASTRGSFSIDNGVLYAGTIGGTLIALNASTGELIWNTDILALYAYVGLSGAPLIVGDAVYIVATTDSGSSYDSSIYAFDKANGRKRFDISLQSTDGDGGIGKFASLCSDGNIIYAAGSGGILAYDFFVKEGPVWTFDCGARASKNIWVSTPVYSDGKLYLVKTPESGNAVLYCVDASSGTELWNVSDGNIGSSSPAVTSDKIVVTGKSGLTVYDKSGVMQFHYSTGYTGFASPVVAGNTAYFGTKADETLFAVDIVNQKLVWSYTFSIDAPGYLAMIEASPAIYDGNLYVGSENCKMYAFGIAPEFSETKNTVEDGTWSAVTKAEVVYEFVPSVLNGILAPEISNGGKTIRIGLDSADSVKVQKKVGGVWSDVGASVDSGGKLFITGDISNAERLRAAFTGRCLGDVNGDSCVDVFDASGVALYDVGRFQFDMIQEYYGDVNGDSCVDVFDASGVALYDVGRLNIYFR